MPIDWWEAQKRADRQKNIMAIRRSIGDVKGNVKNVAGAVGDIPGDIKKGIESKRKKKRNTAFTKAKKLGLDVKSFESPEGYKHRGLAKAVSKKERSNAIQGKIESLKGVPGKIAQGIQPTDEAKERMKSIKDIPGKIAQAGKDIKKKHKDAADQRKVRAGQKRLARTIRESKKKGEKDKSAKSPEQLPGWMQRNVDRQFAMIKDVATGNELWQKKQDESSLAKAEDAYSKTKGLNYIYPDASPEERKHLESVNAGIASTQKRELAVINDLRQRLGMDPLGYIPPPPDLAHNVQGPPAPGQKIAPTPGGNNTLDPNDPINRLANVSLSSDSTQVAKLDSIANAVNQNVSVAGPGTNVIDAVKEKGGEVLKKLSGTRQKQEFLRSFGNKMSREERQKFRKDGIVPERFKDAFKNIN